MSGFNVDAIRREQGDDMDLNVERPTRFYESVVVVHPQATESEQKEIFKKSKRIIGEFKGQLEHLETWGVRKLGNSMGELRTAKYFYALFQGQGDCIKELERNYRINDKVLKACHLRLDERVSLKKHLENSREILKKSADVFAADQARQAAKKPFVGRKLSE